jgi:hypothetical protein
MATSSRDPTENHGTILAPPIAEFEEVRVMVNVEADGYSIPENARGTVVAVYDRSAVYALELADLPGGPEVVTLRADQIERLHWDGRHGGARRGTCGTRIPCDMRQHILPKPRS